LVEQLRQQERWSIPVAAQAHTPTKRVLAAMTFVSYLNQYGLTDPQLRWYLNYCCLDDYGAGLATVSAWAGIHYFASRHGFHAPGTEQVEREGLFTWPQGNHWLTERMSAPLGQRLHTGQLVLRMAQTKHGVEVDVFNVATQTVQRWQARRAIVALPIFVAARVLENAPDFLRQAAARTVYAPWLVANIHIDAPLHDRPGPAPSWDNVLYGDVQSAPGLGYVDAMHQSLKPVPGATVLSYYRALGDETQGAAVGSAPGVAGRRLLLQKPWSTWRDEILSELAIAHPDLPGKATHIDITRYGHAMAIPVPLAANFEPIGTQPTSSKGGQSQKLERLRISHERLNFAHSDWAGYSVFEEAFTMGHAAA
jgi:hypothetical protein